MQNKKFVPAALFLIIGLAGCGGMRLKQFNHVSKREADYSKEQEGVEIRVRKLTKKECPTSAFVPLNISLRNGSHRPIELSASDIGLSTASVEMVYSSLSKRPEGRVFLGMLCAPLLLSGTAFMGFVLATLCSPAVSFIAFSSIAPWGGFAALAGGCAGAFSAVDHNAQLRYYLTKNMLNQLKIRSGEKKTRLVFVPKKAYQTPFLVTVSRLNLEDGKIVKQPIIFNVKL